MLDHRRYPRFREDVDVSVRILPSANAPFIETKHFPYHSRDISITGIQLSVEANFAVGTLLQLEISFNHLADKYRHVGHVVWSQGEIAHDIDAQVYRNIGVKFISIANSEYDFWASAVSTLIKKHRKYHPFHQPYKTTETLP